MAELKQTPLFDQHVALGARLIPFGGWEMPVQYSGILEEHRAVREAAGLFDLSHMGEFSVTGPGAYDYLNRLLSNNLGKLRVGRAQYNLLLNHEGGVVDDLLVYRLDDQGYLVVVNAANMEKDWEWFQEYLPTAGVSLINRSAQTALIAIQGPKSEEILSQVTTTDLAAITYYSFEEATVAGKEVLLSATGYTGERGFELYLDAAEAATVWSELLEVGASSGLVPVGLGARDTLRLEAAFCLYGHELTEETNPWEAGLGWTVKMDKGDFIGKAALQAQQGEALKRKLVGFKLLQRGVPRQGYAILSSTAEEIGHVTSGSVSPTLGESIGLGYVTASQAEPGNHVWLKIRDKAVEAELIDLPFVPPYNKR